MKLLLAVPDPNPLSESLLHEIQSFGFDGVRQDVHGEDHEIMWAQAHAFAASPECFPLVLLAPGTMQRGDGKPWEPDGLLRHVEDECEKFRVAGMAGREMAFEIGNEPDLAHKRWKKHPEELGRIYEDAITIVKNFSPLWHCLSPSISNLDGDSLDYLEEMRLSANAEIAFHRYPAGKDFWAAQRGFRTRGDEVTRLKKLADGASLWHTEGGWAMSNGDYTLTEEEQAERIGDEIRFWNDAGVEAFTLYQLNSAVAFAGDDQDIRRLKSYGVRWPNDIWKPLVAMAIREAKDSIA